ncbi:SprT family protein [Halobacillus sp. ACCC02827]|uniref:SprT family protein n=1 Tax=Halobacillus sp. ACCC02827 TaxID=3052090 RepID=UPI00257085ED|nr:SprT family protein [Halobacillus sp. ACCC02827]WJE16182.1 SprT family protein [Halobacillus sp. ACCC02827]
MMTDQELQQWTKQLSETYFHKPYPDKVYFNSRLRTTGGRYIPSRRTIEINPKYVKELDGKELEGIIKHELCHYHLHIEGKGYTHRDPAFEALLKETGSPRHCAPLPSQRKTSHQYVCTQCGQSYYRQRRMDVRKYRCGKCKGKLKKK